MTRSFRCSPCVALFVSLAVVACGDGASAPTGAGLSEPASRPHIVLILVDDMGWGDVGYHGAEFATPSIDALAASGVRLERFYTSPMCTPSRAQLMTGRQAARMDLHRNINFQEEHGLPPSETTLAEMLSAAGYATAMVGKWHLGHRQQKHHPLQQGFESFYGHLGGWIDYTTHERGGHVDWQRDGETVHEPGYSTDLLAAEAVQVIERHTDERPLFLYLSFNAPHTPVHAAPGQVPAGNSPRDLYRTMMASLDTAVGQVLGALDERGMAGDTLVLFASDNGGSLKYGGSNGGLRGGKFETFEGGIRTPAMIRWPKKLEPNGKSELPFSTLDLLPTLAAAAGGSVEGLELDGHDRLAELLRGDEQVDEPLVVFTRAKNVEHMAVVQGHHKLVRRQSLKDQRVEEWLFDLESDEAEQRDRSAADPGQADALRAHLEELRDALPPGD